jgi:hypothetical protein
MVTGCWDEKAQVRLTTYKDYESKRYPEIQVTVHDGIRALVFVLNEATSSVGPCKTAKRGTLKIKCVVLLDGERTQTRGSVELPLRSDWRWGVDFFIRDDDPAHTCFGCFGSVSYELDPRLGFGEGKKLYIVWGGNSISNPVIY